jgi:hypothetical protein
MKRCLPALSALAAVLVALLVALAPPTAARADGALRCESGRLVTAGDHMYDVRNKCGDPDMVSQRVDRRRIKHTLRRWVHGKAEELEEEREIEVLVDEWVYDLGPERFVRIVSFEDNRVTCVGTGNYGTKRN